MKKTMKLRLATVVSCAVVCMGAVLGANSTVMNGAAYELARPVVVAQSAEYGTETYIIDHMTWDSGEAGKDITVTLDVNGNLTVSGTGEMNGWAKSDDIPWKNRYIRTITVEEGVTSIGSGAFFSENYLVSVSLASSVKTIGSAAFAYCQILEDVELSQGLENIGVGAFYACQSLSRVVLPEGVKVIRDGAFEYCNSMTNIVIPASVESIEWYAFSDCNRLLKVYYNGTESDWENAKAGFEEEGNERLFAAKRNYYSEEQPEVGIFGGMGSYWHWSKNGEVPVTWTITVVVDSITTKIRHFVRALWLLFRIFM